MVSCIRSPPPSLGRRSAGRLQASIHPSTAAELAVEDQEVRVIDAQPLKTLECTLYAIAPRTLYAMPITTE
eukprot:scaffold17555_cov191-Isochrysis_galbana.AAC.1